MDSGSHALRAFGRNDTAVAIKDFAGAIGLEAIVPAEAHDVELIADRGVERCRGWRACGRGSGESHDPHGLGAQIDKLIFDLRAPMPVEEPLDPAAPAQPARTVDALPEKHGIPTVQLKANIPLVAAVPTPKSE